jgi:hypothetical protein
VAVAAGAAVAAGLVGSWVAAAAVVAVAAGMAGSWVAAGAVVAVAAGAQADRMNVRMIRNANKRLLNIYFLLFQCSNLENDWQLRIAGKHMNDQH